MIARASPHAINFSWLLRLRWGAVAGQVATILLVTTWLGIALPLTPLFGIITFEAASNLASAAFARSGRAVEARHIALVMGLDILLVTALLYFAGGAFNPFSSLYLVYVALGAVVLPPRFTWPLLALSMGSFGYLFYGHVVLPLGHAHGSGGEHVDLHLRGMWVAFAVAGVFITYFVQRVTRALAERDAELLVERSAKERSEKLASLASLAAGAAHELSTPLSTIAVVAKELERALERRTNLPEARDELAGDARLIRHEVERCRGILQHLSTSAGESLGEPIVRTSTGALVASALAELPEVERARVKVEREDNPVRVPERAVAQAIRGVIRNALQATPAERQVQVTMAPMSGHVAIRVADAGRGMAPEVLARAGEPFFTTKEPGEGMGLGLFLARTVLDRLGGRLEIQSSAGVGTTVDLVLPAEVERVDTPTPGGP